MGTQLAASALGERQGLALFSFCLYLTPVCTGTVLGLGVQQR